MLTSLLIGTPSPTPPGQPARRDLALWPGAAQSAVLCAAPRGLPLIGRRPTERRVHVEYVAGAVIGSPAGSPPHGRSQSRARDAAAARTCAARTGSPPIEVSRSAGARRPATRWQNPTAGA